MIADEDALLSHLRRDTAVSPPYSNSQMSETAIHREIVRIYRAASSETRVYYDLARDTEAVEEENWVIRWMLWHVFRYRDSRNKNRRQTAPNEGSPSDDDQRNSNDNASSTGQSLTPFSSADMSRGALVYTELSRLRA